MSLRILINCSSLVVRTLEKLIVAKQYWQLYLRVSNVHWITVKLYVGSWWIWVEPSTVWVVCVPHKLLITEIGKYVSVCDIINSYLIDCSQLVNIGIQRSEWTHMFIRDHLKVLCLVHLVIMLLLMISLI